MKSSTHNQKVHTSISLKQTNNYTIKRASNVPQDKNIVQYSNAYMYHRCVLMKFTNTHSDYAY